MRRAGTAAASEIASFGDDARHGVAVFAGSGNNGGDGWIVAAELAKRNLPVHVHEVGAPRSEEARHAREVAITAGAQVSADVHRAEPVIVDALLGTGASGPPRGAIAEAIRIIETRRVHGAHVVSLDTPGGVDAATGAQEGCVRAAATLTFGTMKRGQLMARDACGRIVVLDIGIEAKAIEAELPLLVDSAWAHARIPDIPVTAHKGTRRSLAIVGGDRGMAGAAILAGEGALRTGIGLLRILCHPSNTVAVHAGLPAAIVHEWSDDPAGIEAIVATSDTIAIGPGLGRSDRARDLLERVMIAWGGPVVLDADALNVFAGDVDSLAPLLRGRPAVITPHPAELARLLGVETEAVLEQRFEIGGDLAKRLGCVVLLKGTPTVISSPDGRRYVSASGSAALATGGSGDVLTGMVATLLAHMSAGDDEAAFGTPLAARAAACGAFIHGRAAELCQFVCGITLDDVLRAMPAAWNETPAPLPDGVL